jgi:hypothetical protein
MNRRTTFAALPLALGLLWAACPDSARADDPAPSPEQIRALVARVIAKQHRDDAAIEQYERIERRQTRKSEHDTALAEDKTFRVVPTGTGTVRVQTEERGQPVDAELYRRQLRALEQALVWALNPIESKQKQRVDKAARRSHERAEMVDAVGDAFLFTWLGRETRNGRTLVRLQLGPNPAFKPASRNTSLFSAVHATVWVDEAAAQMVRVEAELIRDVSFGGGIFGKAYRGSRFALEQAEVAPGIWLPTRYDYNFTGRKFLFGFETHELTEVSHYRRIGPPSQALLAIRRELDSKATSPSSP